MSIPTRRSFIIGASAALISTKCFNFTKSAFASGLISVDVLVYGGTASGIMAAYAAAREGAKVAVVLAGPPGRDDSAGLRGDRCKTIFMLSVGFAKNFIKKLPRNMGTRES